MIRILNADALGGLVILALAAMIAAGASDLPMGRALRMGPGWVPMALAGLLAILGVLLLGRGVLRPEPIAPIASLRPPILVLGAVVAFGFGVERLGLVATGGATLMLAGWAAPDRRIGELALVAIGLSLATGALFVGALGLPVPLWPRGLS